MPDDSQGISLSDVQKQVELVRKTLGDLKAIEDQLNKPRSVVCIINNVTDVSLVFGGSSLDHGGFATTPPQSIEPRKSAAFGAQSSDGSLFTGTEGSVWYNTPDGTSFRLHWDNPSAGSNGSESGVDGPLSALYNSYTVTGSGNTGAQMQFVALQKMPTVFRDLWVRTGGATGLLGIPTGDVKPTPDGIGVFMEFAGGAIYSSPNSGTREIHGAIRDKWAEMGWEKGFLGYPVSDTTPTPDRVGAFSHFQHGSIYWSPNTGAHEVHGAIRDKWAEMGWEKSFLGYPVNDEHDSRPSGKNRVSAFQGGEIYADKATGHVGVLNTRDAQIFGEEPGELHLIHGPVLHDPFHIR